MVLEDPYLHVKSLNAKFAKIVGMFLCKLLHITSEFHPFVISITDIPYLRGLGVLAFHPTLFFE
jgi:hypothetical protein